MSSGRIRLRYAAYPSCHRRDDPGHDRVGQEAKLLDVRVTDQLLPERFRRWFASRGWIPRAHQLELLAKARAGRSALLIAPTGGGKTLAGFLPSLVELYEHNSPRAGHIPLPTAGRAPSPLAGEGWGG